MNLRLSQGLGPAGRLLVEALAVLVSDFLQALAAGSRFDALLFFRRLFEALALLDIGDDAVLFAGLGETLESAFKRFVGLYNYTDHDDPLVELDIRFLDSQIYLTRGISSRVTSKQKFQSHICEIRAFFRYFLIYNLRFLKALYIFLPESPYF